MSRAHLATGVVHYEDGQLHCESVALADVARAWGTPSYIYSNRELHKNAKAVLEAAQSLNGECLVCYAVKANGNPTLLRSFARLDLGADIVSGGELFLSLRAGFASQRIVFSGVGKTAQEIREAISADILALHVESEGELRVISEVARSLARVASVAVRVNPDIKVDTHAQVATGLKTHKFGVAPDMALAMMRAAHQDPWLRPVGLSAHLGSQIASFAPYTRLAERLVRMADDLAASGLQLEYIDIGGGLAIDYRLEGPTTQQAQAGFGEWLRASGAAVVQRGYRLLVEPGRSIVGPAGLLLTRVLYTKEQGGRQMIIADAGMTDLIRPALYGAEHPILPVSQSDSTEERLAAVAGPVCESSDFLSSGQSLPETRPGDLLAILQAGAYGFVMSSNYNGRPRPAEILVAGKDMRCIRPRESYDSLLGPRPAG